MPRLDPNGVHAHFQGKRPELSNLMVHAWHRLGLRGRFHLANEASRFEFAVHFVTNVLREQDLPPECIPRSLVSYLNEPVLGPPLSFRNLTRLATELLLREGLNPNARNAHDYMGVAWLFITGIVPKWSIPEALVPDELVAFVNEPVSPDSVNLSPLSRFWLRAYSESKDYPSLYDITCEMDRRAYLADVILHNYGKPGYERLFPGYLLDYWVGPLTDSSDSPTRFEYLVAFSSHVSKAQDGNVLQNLDFGEVRRWYAGAFCKVHPRLLRFASLAQALPGQSPNQRRHKASRPGLVEAMPATAEQEPAVCVVGYGGSTSGLGANHRMSVRAFRGKGVNVVAYDERWNELKARDPSRVGSGVSMRRPVALLHVNADAVPSILARSVPAFLANAHRVGFFLWEVTELPAEHELGVGEVDEIWVPSEFLRAIYGKVFSGPVVNVKKGCSFAEPDPRARKADFGVPNDSFCFVTYFDFDSSIRRKNPVAVVRAFRRAFPTSSDVSLVVKCCNVRAEHWGNRFGDWEALLEESAQDSRIRIINELYPETKLMTLLACADAFVSLHRAEGFGYGPLQAMWLGKPVIATDFSGTQDFCTAETAFPVQCDLRYLAPGEFIFEAPGARWAEPNLEHAASRMREVFADHAAARRIAGVGQKAVRAEYSLDRYADRCFDRLVAAGVVDSMPAKHSRRTGGVARTR